MANISNLENIVKYSKSDVVLGEFLGQGSFGVVQKAKINGQFVALKILQLEVKQDAEAELNIMAKLKHRNVLKLIGIIKENFQRSPTLIFEFMENGSLDSFVRSRKLENSVLINLAYDVACGMTYLHEKHVIHRDLAGRNVLVDVNHRAKVADFGLSRFLNAGESCYYKIYQDKPLPVRWVPKESLPSEDTIGKFTFASDVWSFGVTMWEIWSRGAVPYKGTNEEVKILILEGKNPNVYQEPLCPLKILGIMNSIFEVDPEKRPTFSQLKKELDSIRTDGRKPKNQQLQATEVHPLLEKVEANRNSTQKPELKFNQPNQNPPNQNPKYIKDYNQSRLILISRLKRLGKIKSKQVEDIMKAVDRKDFVNTNPYADLPQMIGHNAMISAPQMHATILELIEERLERGGKALDIGSGSGYLTTCMGLIVGVHGKVVGIDHIADLVHQSVANVNMSHPHLIKEGIVKMRVGDGRYGFEDDGPYDLIHIGAATQGIKMALANQLRDGGRIIAPLGRQGSVQELVVLDKVGNNFKRKQILETVMFAPLTSESEQLAGLNRTPD